MAIFANTRWLEQRWPSVADYIFKHIFSGSFDLVKLQQNSLVYFVVHPTGISNCIRYKVWNEITYPVPNFVGVWEWQIISSHTLLGM